MVGLSMLLFAAAAAAQGAEIEYDRGTLGYEALVSANYSTAETQLRGNVDAGFDDPARLINLGQVMAHTGRTSMAKKLFKRAMEADDATIILADGRELSSRIAAREALEALRKTQSSSR